MRVVLIHPNYHSGGAEIAGNWPPAWVAYISGALKAAGFPDVRFIDAMTDHIADDRLEALLRAERPDVVMATAITPAIYRAQETLALAKRVHPEVPVVLGGIHGTFMYGQVLREAPWIDYIVRGEGEAVVVNLVRALAAGRLPDDRARVRGIAYLDADGRPVATPVEPPIADLDALTPDWDILDWSKYIYIPLNTRVAIPNFARGCPFTCSFCSQWKFWRTYRTRDPRKFVDEIEHLVRKHQVGFFILADEEPTIHRRKFVELCEELVRRDLGIQWGMNTRVTDILRDEALLPLYRRAGLIHVSLGTEAAAQLKLDRFNKEIKLEQSRKAIALLRRNGIVTEAQFIVGLENETPETIEETYRMALDWGADMANWNCYTPWPFSDLFAELGDKVEVRDYAKYNFVTPIIQPEGMTREEVLKGVLRNYRRFYFRKATGGYLWDRDRRRRRYLQGCLKAYLKSAVERRFYDLGRIEYWGQSSVDWKFDERKSLEADRAQRARNVREIQHVHGKPAARALPVVDVAGHALPADEFIAPRRSAFAAAAGAGAAGAAGAAAPCGGGAGAPAEWVEPPAP